MDWIKDRLGKIRRRFPTDMLLHLGNEIFHVARKIWKKFIENSEVVPNLDKLFMLSFSRNSIVVVTNFKQESTVIELWKLKKQGLNVSNKNLLTLFGFLKHFLLFQWYGFGDHQQQHRWHFLLLFPWKWYEWNFFGFG